MEADSRRGVIHVVGVILAVGNITLEIRGPAGGTSQEIVRL